MRRTHVPWPKPPPPIECDQRRHAHGSGPTLTADECRLTRDMRGFIPAMHNLDEVLQVVSDWLQPGVYADVSLASIAQSVRKAHRVW